MTEVNRHTGEREHMTLEQFQRRWAALGLKSNKEIAEQLQAGTLQVADGPHQWFRQMRIDETACPMRDRR